MIIDQSYKIFVNHYQSLLLTKTLSTIETSGIQSTNLLNLLYSLCISCRRLHWYEQQNLWHPGYTSGHKNNFWKLFSILTTCTHRTDIDKHPFESTFIPKNYQRKYKERFPHSPIHYYYTCTTVILILFRKQRVWVTKCIV